MYIGHISMLLVKHMISDVGALVLFVVLILSESSLCIERMGV